LVRQLVDEDERGVARERGVEFELAQRRAAIVDRHRVEGLEAREQRVGLGPAVSLDIPDDRVDPVGLLLSHGFEHRVRLADPGGGAEEYLQLSSTLTCFLRLDASQERFGVWPVGAHGPSVAPGARPHSKRCGRFEPGAGVSLRGVERSAP